MPHPLEVQSSKLVITNPAPVPTTTLQVKPQGKVGKFDLDKNIYRNWTTWREKCLEEMKLYEEISDLEKYEDIQETNLEDCDGSTKKKGDNDKKFTCEMLLTGVGYSRFLEVAELTSCTNIALNLK